MEEQVAAMEEVIRNGRSMCIRVPPGTTMADLFPDLRQAASTTEGDKGQVDVPSEGSEGGRAEEDSSTKSKVLVDDSHGTSGSEEEPGAEAEREDGEKEGSPRE